MSSLGGGVGGGEGKRLNRTPLHGLYRYVQPKKYGFLAVWSEKAYAFCSGLHGY